MISAIEPKYNILIKYDEDKEEKKSNTLYVSCTKLHVDPTIRGFKLSFKRSDDTDMVVDLCDTDIVSISITMISVHTGKPMSEFSFTINPGGLVCDNKQYIVYDKKPESTVKQPAMRSFDSDVYSAGNPLL